MVTSHYSQIQFKKLNNITMFQKIKITIALMLPMMIGISKAQTFIPIPDTLSGNSINLVVADSTHQFYTGTKTKTIGYNGSYLGPTMILNKGQQVTLNVKNQLNDTTTTHWHGLHVSPMNDGSPHNPIMAGKTWSPSFSVMDNAATYWYHPHLHGKTMEQVLMGAAGLIIVRDTKESALNLPRTYGVDDFPLVLQWKTFDATSKQFVMDDELDNATMVNGTINGQLNVPAQLVRFRVLNGSSHRYFYFAMNDNRNFKVIGGDESLLNAPVSVNKLIISPGERYEVIIDFSGQNGNTYYLKQLGTQLPAGYPGGPPDQMGMGTPGPLDNKDFNLLQFNVTATTASPVLSIPASLVTNVVTPTAGAGSKSFNLQGSPMMSMTNFTINGVQYNHNVINFYTKQDSVMIWSLTNRSMMPHPWHIHGNYFYITSINGNTPPAYMQGRKDVVTVSPQGGTVQLVMKYEDFNDPTMPYMFHCHINSHEDNGMMGQFIVNPTSTGINDVEANLHSAVYPNPSYNGWTIDGTSNDVQISFSLTNTLGQVVLQKAIIPIAGKFNFNILSDELAAGMYVLSISSKSQNQTIKLIKQ
jgi:bilirubin oxidase